MRRKAKKRKKRSMAEYAIGTSKTGVNYMQNPAEVLTQNSINVAKAVHEGETNPFVVGLQSIAGLATSLGSKETLGGYGQALSKAGKAVGGSSDTAAMGGVMPKGQVEAEGGEIVETPGGSPQELTGKKHEQGGQDIDVPKGTLIFSDRIKIGGKTMADRKKAREKRLAKAQNLSTKDPTDKINKETVKRITQQNEMEELSDLEVQGVMRQMQDVYDATAAALGTGTEGTKYFTGTDVDGTDVEAGGTGNVLGGMGAGDLVGMASNIYGMFSPLSNTRENRAGDTPNINPYKEFGIDALEANAAAMSKVDEQFSKTKTDLNLSRNKMLKKGRKSARGVNQMRAMDLAADVNANKALTDAYDSHSKQIMKLFSDKANLENVQDTNVMKGEADRDLADRQDRDAYYTNLASDKANVSQMGMHLGKSMNVVRENEDLLGISQYLSKYGVKLERVNGKLQIVNANEEGN